MQEVVRVTVIIIVTMVYATNIQASIIHIIALRKAIPFSDLYVYTTIHLPLRDVPLLVDIDVLTI